MNKMNSGLESFVNWLQGVVTSPVGAVGLTCLVAYKIYSFLRPVYPAYDDEDYRQQGHEELLSPLKNLRMNFENLSKYNANNPNGRLLVALQGIIYDVSCCREDFGPDGSLKELAGTDIMGYIRKIAQADGKDFTDYLQRWQNMLDDRFYVAGKLIGDDDAGERSDGDCKQRGEQSAEAD